MEIDTVANVKKGRKNEKGNTPMRAKCAKCHDIVEVSHLREYKTCKCGAISLDYGDGYYSRMGGNPEDFDKEFDKAQGIDRFKPFKAGITLGTNTDFFTTDNSAVEEIDTEPMFCKEPDDFVLMVLQIIKAAWFSAKGSEEPDDMLSYLTMAAKIICHEYMACVLSGLIEPYTFSLEFKNNEYEDFRKWILDAKAEAMREGVPMTEKDGKFTLDVEKIIRE